MLRRHSVGNYPAEDIFVSNWKCIRTKFLIEIYQSESYLYLKKRFLFHGGISVRRKRGQYLTANTTRIGKSQPWARQNSISRLILMGKRVVWAVVLRCVQGYMPGCSAGQERKAWQGNTQLTLEKVLSLLQHKTIKGKKGINDKKIFPKILFYEPNSFKA